MSEGTMETVEPTALWEAKLEAVVDLVEKHVKSRKKVEPLAIAAVGGKSVGKSTFLRALTDKLLERYENVGNVEVFYFDTDIGQPERGVPGIVSLSRLPCETLGDSIFLGDASPEKHPTTYLEACRELVSSWHSMSPPSKSKRILLVNTHGWVTGIGGNMVESICSFACVNIVVHLRHFDRVDEVDESRISTVKKTFQLDSSNNTDRYFPQELRFLRFSRYFQAKNLTELELLQPIVVNVGDITIHSSIEAQESNATNELFKDTVDLVKAINANFVGICKPRHGTTLFDFLALGLVRAVNPTRGDLYIVTPASPEVLADSTCLVLGTQIVPLARWEFSNSQGKSNLGSSPFFVYAEQAIDVFENTTSILQRRRKRIFLDKSS